VFRGQRPLARRVLANDRCEPQLFVCVLPDVDGGLTSELSHLTVNVTEPDAGAARR
jgi:hypothetical protein